MSLIKWEPFDEFDRIFREFGNLANQRGSSLDLAVDVYADGNTLVAEMNMPGLKAEDIDVQVENNHLHITGTREEVAEKKEKNHYAKEIRRGSFERLIPLPEHVDTEGVTATYKDGVLKVTMPTIATTEQKKITVSAE
jgi:HSP20 family protein